MCIPIYTWFLGFTRVFCPTNILIGSATSARLIGVPIT